MFLPMDAADWFHFVSNHKHATLCFLPMDAADWFHFVTIGWRGSSLCCSVCFLSKPPQFLTCAGTMPHRKYYNLELYEREKAAKRGGKLSAGVKKAMVGPLLQSHSCLVLGPATQGICRVNMV
jgi:hypothetical protein